MPSDEEYKYKRVIAILDKLNYKHLVSGKVVADAGEGLTVDLELTRDELSAILHQRANKMFQSLRKKVIERSTHQLSN